MKIKITLYDKDTIGVNVICMMADLLSIFFLERSIIISFLLLVSSVIFNLEARKHIKNKK